MYTDDFFTKCLFKVDRLLFSYDAISVDGESIDCDKLLVKNDNGFWLISHMQRQKSGKIEIYRIDLSDISRFPKRIYFSEESFFFDKLMRYENGDIEGIRLRSDDCYLFIFADEYNLIVTRSEEDLFAE